MRTGAAILGLAILAAGLIIMVYGGQTVMKDVYMLRTADLGSSASVIGEESYWEVPRRIDRPSTVNGRGTVTASATRQPSDIDFLVLDSTNFETWKQRLPGVNYVMKRVRAQEKFTFNFTVTRNDTYHFVFDNYYSTVRKEAAIQVNNTYGIVEKQAVIDRTFNYAGIAVAGIGAVMTIYGLAMPDELVWSKDRAF